jgi:hypothetical protein
MVMVTGFMDISLARLPIFDTLGGSLGLAPACRWYAHDASKSSIERCLGIITHPRSDLSEAEWAFA